jgi:DNA-binding NtrC family response regulator
VNCAALPSHLIESELFGHIKGSFTGAVANRVGRFEEADGGTLFLDEIGDLPLEMQVKLLRFLQNGEFQRIGESDLRTSDVRILAATNVDLEHAMSIGEFREDLYYRLNVIHLEIPPLRERPRDIQDLTQAFLNEFSAREKRSGLRVSKQAVESLVNHPWPGNVRELRNTIERAVLLGEAEEIGPGELNLKPARAGSSATSLPDTVETMERQLIADCLEQSNGNQSACARKLGISERVLRYKLQKHGLK